MRAWCRLSIVASTAALLITMCRAASAQTPAVAPPSPAPAAPRPSLQAGQLDGSIRLDGKLDEAAWQTAPRIDNLTMSEPTPGIAPTGRTIVSVLADRRVIVI